MSESVTGEDMAAKHTATQPVQQKRPALYGLLQLRNHNSPVKPSSICDAQGKIQKTGGGRTMRLQRGWLHKDQGTPVQGSPWPAIERPPTSRAKDQRHRSHLGRCPDTNRHQRSNNGEASSIAPRHGVQQFATNPRLRSHSIRLPESLRRARQCCKEQEGAEALFGGCLRQSQPKNRIKSQVRRALEE